MFTGLRKNVYDVDDPIFPAKLYIFHEDGTYTEPTLIVSQAQLDGPGTKLIVRDAIQRGVEVILADPGDRCLFHAKDGKILFPQSSK